jgi:hypothetical protein
MPFPRLWVRQIRAGDVVADQRLLEQFPQQRPRC